MDKIPDLHQYYDEKFRPVPKEKAKYRSGYRFEGDDLIHYTEEIKK